jgi:hypothetical protein
MDQVAFERVAFIVESTGERIGCMLNPETLVMRRWAGLRRRRSLGGAAGGARLADDPLLFTGGGATELWLELLFDVSIGGSTVQAGDVRDLTRPLWQLAESGEVVDGYGRPPLIRFVWGKAWSVPGVVAAVAERLEQFEPGGAPRRSWMRLQLLRVNEPASAEAGAGDQSGLPGTAEEPVDVTQVLGGGVSPGQQEEEAGSGQRLDEMAQRYYGDASLWRLIAEANGIDDPLSVPAGQVLQIPRRSDA